MKKVLGIVTLLSILALITILVIVFQGSKQDIQSIYIQSSIFLFILSTSLIGAYALQAFSPDTKKMSRLGIFGLGGLLIVMGGLISFNIVDFRAGINWLISLGIVYILLVQLQLLGWGRNSGLITKIGSFLLILANLFLVIFFIVKWEYADLAIWIHVSVLLSLVSFLGGLLFLPKAKTVSEKA
ncbi:MAG: hypothetical protein MI810_17310 [Flavobacteriales bacterium]|nr:hypothetical protein [Flavobacteriales bacterium]